MKKVILLVLGISMISASCTLFGGSGSRGVFKSQDNGETYAAANSLDPEGSIGGLDTNTLVMDHSNTDVIYLGSSAGVHKTENGAESWKHMLTGLRIGDLSIDPRNSSVLFASGMRGENGKILKSVDGGVSWTDLYTEPANGNAVLSVAVSTANSQIVLAGLNNGEILRSQDGGTSWQSVRDTGNAIMDIEFVNTGAAYALAQNNGLYYTTDHGVNWVQVPVVVSDPVAPQATGTSGITFRQLASSYIFNDMTFDPRNPSVIYLGTEKGIIKTSDGAKTWQLLSLPVQNQSLPVSAITVHPDSSDIVLAAIGSTLFKTTNGGASWESRKLGTEQRVKFILIDPRAVNTIYLGLGTTK